MERYIFDIDGTLLSAKWEEEDNFFRDKFGEQAETLIKEKIALLLEYEDKYPRYDIELLSKHMSKCGVLVSESFIKEWISYNGEIITDVLNDKAIYLLEYLKHNDKKMSILSNWHKDTQISRLKRAGIYEYFDTIVCGETILKPNYDSYKLAAAGEEFSKCLMIGDDYAKDYLGAVNVGMNAYLVDQQHGLEKVKTLGGR